jgi:hypothetical protein
MYFQSFPSLPEKSQVVVPLLAPSFLKTEVNVTDGFLLVSESRKNHLSHLLLSLKMMELKEVPLLGFSLEEKGKIGNTSVVMLAQKR